jgi:peptidoglycan/xylan/chitin deacetylase (PgdA/CDA1 family)
VLFKLLIFYSIAPEMYFVKTPGFVQRLFPNLLWRVFTEEKALFLSFDDGPTPQTTPWILKQLRQFNARATFFCVGENVVKHRNLFIEIINDGHSVGNHTFNHLNGWKNGTKSYLENVRRCASLVPGNLFRPPYGRMSPGQLKALQDEYKIVMWDVLSGDFDEKLSPTKCLQNVTDHANAGSIMVFHDNKKAMKRLEFVLPQVLKFYSEKGFDFRGL